MVEADLVGPGSIEGVIKGKHYNRCIRVFRSVYEALQRLKYESFIDWLEENDKHEVDEIY